jgi:hypothetical protein
VFLKESKAGDVIAVILGGQAPFILRRNERRYTLIGECYIQGIMAGKASRMVDFRVRSTVKFEISFRPAQSMILFKVSLIEALEPVAVCPWSCAPQNEKFRLLSG